MRLLLVALLTCSIVAAGHASGPVVLPLTFEKNLPLAPVAVNSTSSATFILDSAASGCLIDTDRAAAIGLKATAKAFSRGSGGLQQVDVIPHLRLALGQITIETDCYTLDMHSLGFNSHVDGVLGMPLFGQHVVEIDYPGSKVRIFRPHEYHPSRNAEAIPIRVAVGPIVRGCIRLRGRHPIEFDMQLDTGSAHVLTVCTPVVDRYQLLEFADEIVPGRTRGVGGNTPDVTGRIEGVCIGRFLLDNPLVHFSRDTKGAFASEQYFAANLGGGFMKHYKVTFDIPGLKVYLE
jgi:hypothetical protein